MNFDINKISDSIISKISNSGIIERVGEITIKDQPNKSILNKMFDEPQSIALDDGGLFIFHDGDKIYCPEIKVTISEKGEWLSDFLPEVAFDIDQSGNVRKAEEAEAIYCVIAISAILNDDSFKNDVQEIINNYDFGNMKSIDLDSKSFSNLLSEWQGYQSVILNILVSACRYKLSDYKKDADKFLKDGLSDIEVAELRDLDSKIRRINFEYSEGILSPIEVKKLTKIQRLQKIDERDSLIDEEISQSKYGVLYKILRLSTEYISPINKKKIQMWVDSEVTKIITEAGTPNLKDDRTQLISQITRRAFKLEKNSIRRINIERYINDRENYKLPPKM